MTSTAAKRKNMFITVWNTKYVINVDINMAPEIMKSLVKLLPCFITTDMIKPLNACK